MAREKLLAELAKVNASKAAIEEQRRELEKAKAAAEAAEKERLRI